MKRSDVIKILQANGFGPEHINATLHQLEREGFQFVPETSTNRKTRSGNWCEDAMDEYIKMMGENFTHSSNTTQTSKETKPTELKIVSQIINLNQDEKCAACGVVQLNTQKEIYNYRSRKFNILVFGCFSCWQQDGSKLEFKCFRKVELSDSKPKSTTQYELVK